MQQPKPSSPRSRRPAGGRPADGKNGRQVYRRDPNAPPRDGTPARQGGAPRQSAVARGKAQRAKKRTRRRREAVTFLVMAILVVGLIIVALVVTLGKRNGDDSSSFLVIAVAPDSSAPASRSESRSSSEPFDASGIYDEAEMPPLFNFENPIPDEYHNALQLADIGGGQRMATRAAEAFNAMYAAAGAENIVLTQVSGYRTYDHQLSNYNTSIQNYLSQGYSQEEATARTEGYYAIPGTSEHEAGLAIDIGWIEDDFENSDAYAWLAEHAAEYGFILRYRADTFDTTHINYEPWHYRYIGANHARRYLAGGYATLEDYVADFS